ncbi:MAG TPA: methylamine utilization protein [Methylotenera sp.]|nr:methylamine utilization protein [Methylotenera sp.]
MHIGKYFAGLGFLLSSSLALADMTFLVQDQDGKPLVNSVLEVVSAPLKSGDNSDLGLIDQIGKAFVPELVVIQKGQLVDFPNSDNIRHHVYSFSPAKTFELKLYADRPEEPVMFDQHGVVVLGCNIHDSMVGYIYVAADQRVVKTDSQGLGRLPISSDNSQISVWHANQSNGPEHRDIYEVAAIKQSADKQHYIVTLDITPPTARDTFEDTFRANY